MGVCSASARSIRLQIYTLPTSLEGINILLAE